MKQLLISIDLDEFCHVRWVSGSNGALYSNRRDYYQQVYNSSRHGKELIDQTNIILDDFSSSEIRSTFFIPGEVAENYPELVKIISEEGHEIACHSYRHIDLTLHSQKSFRDELIKAKSLLEDLSGKEVIGVRMPNLIIKDWVKEIFLELGFMYDSSICPSVSLTGKFGDYVGYPVYPYATEINSFKPGDSNFWEFPLPVFPVLRLPGATGIVTRALGKGWTYITLWNVQCRGNIPSYYFHPWELGKVPQRIKLDTFYKKLFTRRTGKWMRKFVKDLVQSYHCFGYKEYIQKQIVCDDH